MNVVKLNLKACNVSTKGDHSSISYFYDKLFDLKYHSTFVYL